MRDQGHQTSAPSGVEHSTVRCGHRFLQEDTVKKLLLLLVLVALGAVIAKKVRDA